MIKRQADHSLFRTVEFSKNQLEVIFDHLEPMCLVSQEIKVIRLNKAMAELLEKEFIQCIGYPLEKLFYKWDLSMLTTNINLVLSARRPIQVNEYEMTEKGKKAWFEITFYPITDEKHSTNECVISFKNVTELVLTKRILLEQYKKLEHQQMVVENKHALLMETRKSLDKAYRSIMDELNVAQEVQQGIMPRDIPSFPGVDFFASYEPIRQVGGDIYDILDLGNNKIGIFIGDVSGHGLAAAFVGAMVKMALIDHAYKTLSPKALFTVINRNLLQHLKSGHYLTAFYGILDLTDYTLLYSKASHPQPLLIRADGSSFELETGGMFLGMIESPGYEEKSIQLTEGDRIYFFTDGYFEIRDSKGKQFLYTSLCDIIQSFNHLPKPEAHDKIDRKLQEFSNQSEAEDDRTFLIMEISQQCRIQQLPLLGYFSHAEEIILRVYSTEPEFNDIFKEMEAYFTKKVASEEIRKQIIISAIELTNNALEHGNRCDPQKQIEIAYTATETQVKLTVKDEGDGFSPELLRDPRIKGNWKRERGRGVFIVQSYMDEVYFNQKGNTVTIIKHLKPE